MICRFPRKQIEQLGYDGFMGACIDPKYGGKGLDLLTFTLVIEELSRCCASTGIIVSIHNCLYANLVQSYGTAEQIQQFLVPFTNEYIGVFALSESSKCFCFHLTIEHFQFQSLKCVCL